MFSIHVFVYMVLGVQQQQLQSQLSNTSSNYGNQMTAGGTSNSQYTVSSSGTLQGQYPVASQAYTGVSTSQNYQVAQQSQNGYNQYAQATGLVAAKPVVRMQG